MADLDASKISLVYFDGRGRAEPIRYLFPYAQIAYEDERIPGVKEWEALKPNLLLGQLPVLKLANEKGETVSIKGQSGAIVRAFAAKYGLNGQNPDQAFIADEIYECTRDLMGDAEKLMWNCDPGEKEKAIKELKEERLPRFLNFFEAKLKENGGKFVAGGDKFTYADFAIACMLDNFDKEEVVDLGFQRFDRPGFVTGKELQSGYPGLAALKKAVEESPGIRAYLSKRPVTPF